MLAVGRRRAGPLVRRRPLPLLRDVQGLPPRGCDAMSSGLSHLQKPTDLMDISHVVIYLVYLARGAGTHMSEVLTGHGQPWACVGGRVIEHRRPEESLEEIRSTLAGHGCSVDLAAVAHFLNLLPPCRGYLWRPVGCSHSDVARPFWMHRRNRCVLVGPAMPA